MMGTATERARNRPHGDFTGHAQCSCNILVISGSFYGLLATLQISLSHLNCFRKYMVPRERIELSTSPLPRVTTTLRSAGKHRENRKHKQAHHGNLPCCLSVTMSHPLFLHHRRNGDYA